MKEALILGNEEYIFTKELKNNLDSKYNFELLDIFKKYRVPYILYNIPYIGKKLRNIYIKLFFQKKYDIINIHYVTPKYIGIIKHLKNKSDRLIVSIYGSDFYQSNKKTKEELREIFNIVDTITFANEDMAEDFFNYYKSYNDKINIARFGIAMLDYIDEQKGKIDLKKELNIPNDKLIVSCGNSGVSRIQHIKILNRIPKEMRDKIVLLVSMTYGDEVYIQEVKEFIENNFINYMIFDSYLSYNDAAKYRKISDVHFNLPLTDQLSSFFIEHLYTGNIVITGRWLPYKSLKDLGVFFLEIESFDEIEKLFVEIFYNYDNYLKKCDKNKELIEGFSSWGMTKRMWEKIYESKKII